MFLSVVCKMDYEIKRLRTLHYKVLFHEYFSLENKVKLKGFDEVNLVFPKIIKQSHYLLVKFQDIISPLQERCQDFQFWIECLYN